MDNELKQRLIGAVVVTALAAIFIPMLFDDPVDTRTKTVSEMTVPPMPANQTSQADKLPANKQQALNQGDPGLAISEVEDDPANASVISSPSGNEEPAARTGADSQDLQAKIAGLPPANAKNSGIQETIPPEEEEQVSDDAGTEPSPLIQSGKKTDQIENTSKKSALAKPLKEKSKPVEDKIKTSAEKTDAKNSKSKLVKWSLQAGSFSKKENAQAMVDKLRKQGFPASMTSKGNLYRIKIGPELDKKRAAEMKSKLAALKIQSYLQAE